MHYSRIRTARSLTVSRSIRLRGVPTPPECIDPPHWMQTFPSPVNRMTNRCKNITLPRTSFACGKKMFHDILGNFEFLTIPYFSRVERRY